MQDTHGAPLTPRRAYASTLATSLSRWERRGLFALLGLFLFFGVIVEKRSAFSTRRMTDLAIYLRAAWAVRIGADIYDITDENDWHYQYPPLFAIVMTPLADPPAAVDRAGMLPYAVSTALWYAFSLLCLGFAVHQLAGILEEGSGDPLVRNQPVGCRRWWGLRVLPVLACLIPLGQTLVRGQVNLLVLALLSGFAAALYRGRSARAGLWLSGAICLKVIPAFLLLVPLWRRNMRCLLGCATGLVVGLCLIPAAVFGVPRTLAYYAEYDRKVIRPGFGDDLDKSRAQELTAITSTDNQSLQAIIHNATHLERIYRPPDASPLVRGMHWLVGGLLTGVTLWAAGRRPLSSPVATILFPGALLFNMLLLSPVCHLHYFILMLPIVMALTAATWERAGGMRLGKPLTLLLAGNAVAGLMPVLPIFEVARDLGVATYGAFALWLAGCLALWKASRPQLPPAVVRAEAA